jgi:hypothetical protein
LNPAQARVKYAGTQRSRAVFTNVGQRIAPPVFGGSFHVRPPRQQRGGINFGTAAAKCMHISHMLARLVLFLAVAGVLSAGCGPGESPISQPPPPETNTGAVAPVKTMPPQRLPKTVNPNASNKGIKGKYAD